MLVHNNPTLLLLLLIPNLPAAYHMVGTILVIIFLTAAHVQSQISTVHPIYHKLCMEKPYGDQGWELCPKFHTKCTYMVLWLLTLGAHLLGWQGAHCYVGQTIALEDSCQTMFELPWATQRWKTHQLC